MDEHNATHTHNDDDRKLNGEEQGMVDKVVEEFGEVEAAVGHALGDDLMEAEGTRKVVEHGDVEDAAEALAKHNHQD